MKNKVFIFIVSILMCGCEPRDKNVHLVDGNEVRTAVIEDCEYLYDYHRGLISLTHKGNCTNKIHYTK